VISRIIFCLIPLLWLSACTTNTPIKPEDPLADRIFVSSTHQEISQQELLDDLLTADVIYLGEKHDQVAHHRLQLLVLELLLENGLKPAIGMEVFSLDKTSKLMTYTQGKPRPHLKDSGFSAEDWLRTSIGWDNEGNRNWQFYGPILRKAREHNLTVFGADLPQSLRTRISKVGKVGLSPVEKELIVDTGLKDENYRRFMYERFKQAHCGWGSDEYFGRLYDNWLARNDTMARGIIATLGDADESPVILITGTGHSQYNQGVYERVQHQNPDLKQVNIGFRVLSDDLLPVTEYIHRTEFDGRDYGFDHPYLWMTSPQAPPAEDPCKAYLESRKDHGK